MCAFGEALFGPGGGATGYDLRDVVDVPLRIVWHAAEVAREMWDPAVYAYLMEDLARSGAVVDFRRGEGGGVMRARGCSA